MNDISIISGAKDLFEKSRAKELLNKIDSDPEIQKILLTHSCVSAGLAWIPLPTAGPVICLFNIYSMYVRINNQIGIKLSKNAIKSIAGMIAANLTGFAALFVGTVASEALKFIPGIGTIAGAALEAVIFYSLTAVQGKLYCEWLRKIDKKTIINEEGDIDENLSKSTVEEIFSDKNRIQKIIDEEKQKAKSTNLKKYKNEAKELLKKYKQSNDN